MFKLGALAVFLFAGTVNATLVEDENNINLEPLHLETYLNLDSVPEKAILQLYKNSEELRKRIKNVYLIKTIAENSRKEGLLKTEYEKQKLQQIIDRYYFDEKLKKVLESDLPDFEPMAKLEYQVNKENYKTIEQVDVSHIMLTEKSSSELEIQIQIKEIQNQLDKGISFVELADKYSEDPTIKKNHGKIGRFSRERLVKEFADVAFKLKPGEISSPVKTKFGYHLIKLDKYYPSKYKEYKDVKDTIIAKIKKEYLTNRQESFFEQVIDENKMKFNDQEIKQYVNKTVKHYESVIKK